MIVGRRLGPFLYGALFVVALPAGLWWWAAATEAVVGLPAYRLPLVGWGLSAVGLAMILAAMLALRVHGGGLPMNAYPPPRYVRQGPYRWIRHPIYVGFAILVAGASLGTGSASGLWLVTPLVALGMAALVAGYEGPDLRRRFGEAAAEGPGLRLPGGDGGPPSLRDRLSVVALVFLPWTVAYEGAFRLGIPPDAVEAFLPFERGWPVLVWTEVVYVSVYPLVVLAPFAVRERRVLRHLAVTALLATAVVTFLYATVPLVAPPRPFQGDGLWARMLTAERAMSNTVAAFPSFHVIWTLIAAEAWAATYPRRAPLFWVWAVAISASCITTGMHALADVLAAVIVWAGLRSYRGLWAALRSAAEGLANSWREWRLGPVRLLSYGFWGAAAGGVGLWLTGSLAGVSQTGGAAILCGSALLGAGLWAQKLEGSSVLSRPFGYFGSLVGASAGAAAAAAAGYDLALLLAAVATAAPWIQALGRLRCLVQGCCHGHEAPASVGIRYTVPRSRVSHMAGLAGRPLHPTPLYSIGANVVVGILLARLWSLGASLGMVTGLYLVLAGMARFVEENYRGEPQTPVLAGLRLYQWLAIILVLIGVSVTTADARGAPDTGPSAEPTLVAASVGFALVCLLALGVDFPSSTRRFARLAPSE